MAPRLELITGKGGVGKTTLSAALAVRAARQGRTPLVVELGHRSSLATIFGSDGLEHAPTEVAPGVHALSLDFDEAVLAYASAQLRVRAVARAVLRSRAIAGFLHAAPGVAEVATYHHLSDLVAETRGGAPRWDPILVDLDATGHALMFLELPRVLDGLLGTGPLRHLLEHFSETLADGDLTALHLVTLPRALPAEETAELSLRLRRDARIHIGQLFINRMPGVPHGADAPDARAILEAALVPDGAGRRTSLAADVDVEAGVLADLTLLDRAVAHRARAEAHVAELRALPHEVRVLPALDGPLDIDALAHLGALARGESP